MHELAYLLIENAMYSLVKVKILKGANNMLVLSRIMESPILLGIV